MIRSLAFFGLLAASGIALGCGGSGVTNGTGGSGGGDGGSGGSGGATSSSGETSSATGSTGTGGSTAAPLSNDGDKFILVYSSYTGGEVSEYRLYSMRNASDPARVMVARTVGDLTMTDPYVYDGVHAYYQVYAVVAGAEKLILSADGVQPPRTWSEPLTITAPGKYTGNWRSTDPSQAAVVIAKGVTGVVIENSRVASMGDGISANAGGVGVEVRGSRGWGLHPMKQDSGHGDFVTAYQPVSVVVEHDYAEAWRFDVYVDGGATTKAQAVRVRYNRLRNLQGRKTNADGTYQQERVFPVAHAVQLNHVFACPDTEIAWNEMSQEPSIGFGEDIVNHYVSSGTPASHAKIHDNGIYGGYAISPGTKNGPGAYAGCGVITDGGETGDLSQHGYLDIYNNIIIGTTNAGIGLANGSNVTVHDNRTISAGVLEDGTAIWANNVGVYMAEQGGAHTSGHFQKNTTTANYSGWMQLPGTQQNPSNKPVNNTYWFPSDMLEGSHAAYGEQQYAPAPITVQTERDEYQLFWTRTRAATLTVGPE